MKRRQRMPEQVVPKVEEGQKLLAGGKPVDEVAKYLEVTLASWYRWVNQYGA